jgi:hypothetical protein
MTTRRVSVVTDDYSRGTSAAGPVAYWDASSRHDGTIGARERFEELTTCGLLAGSYATLRARGDYNPQRHGDGNREPPTAAEHLEILALGEVLARHYRHPAYVDAAVKAGAWWSQVAEAVGSDEAQVRQEYRQWADRQHRLHADYEGRFGMDDAEHAAAVRRAAVSPTGALDRAAADKEAGR